MSRPKRDAKKPKRFLDTEELLTPRRRVRVSVPRPSSRATGTAESTRTSTTQSQTSTTVEHQQEEHEELSDTATTSVQDTPAAAAGPSTRQKRKTHDKPAQKQRGKKEKIGKAQALSAAEVDAILKNKEERDKHADELVADLTESEAKDLLASICKENPCFILDVMAVRQVQGPPKPPSPEPHVQVQPHWCTCSNCRIMPLAIEDVCCKQTPEMCISLTPELQALCLDQHVLHLAMHYRADVLALQNYLGGNIREKNKSLRFGGYRQYTLWQHGRLGVGNRVPIPSCCVWKIRNTFPDESGQYVGFRPGLF